MKIIVICLLKKVFSTSYNFKRKFVIGYQSILEYCQIELINYKIRFGI